MILYWMAFALIALLVLYGIFLVAKKHWISSEKSEIDQKIDDILTMQELNSKIDEAIEIIKVKEAKSNIEKFKNL